jgi:hypothetical protein
VNAEKTALQAGTMEKLKLLALLGRGHGPPIGPTLQILFIVVLALGGFWILVGPRHPKWRNIAGWLILAGLLAILASLVEYEIQAGIGG